MINFKKILAIIFSISIITMAFPLFNSISVLANESLTDAEIAAKNYPIPNGYEVSTIFNTYDSSIPTWLSSTTEEGTYYDTQGKYISMAKMNKETSITGDIILDGDGFMFWYRSDSTVDYRLRKDSSTGSIMIYGYLPACTQGQWVTFYYYGKNQNMFINSSSIHKDLRTYVEEGDKFDLNLYFGTDEQRTVYFDEFISFKATKTSNDNYEDGDFFRFSGAEMSKENTTIGDYSAGDGSVILSSTYGSTAKQYPIDITYDVNSEAIANAIAKTNRSGGSGYLKVTIQDINALNNKNEIPWVRVAMSIDSINGDDGPKSIMFNNCIKKFEITETTTDESGIAQTVVTGYDDTNTYLIDVSNVTDSSTIKTLNVKISGLSSSDSGILKDVKIKIAPIEVYEYSEKFPENATVIQAEDLKCDYYDSNAYKDVNVGTTSDGNNTYVYMPSATAVSNSFLNFTLPEMEVGEYNVYAYTMDNTSSGKLIMFLNNRNQINDLRFTDSYYSTYSRFNYHELGSVKISKEYQYGASTLTFRCIKDSNRLVNFDYFVFVKTDTTVEAEPASNFEIKAYPEMDNYEVKTVLNNFDTYLCSGDVRYYANSIVSGYVGNSTAYNLNSICYNTSLDTNTCWSGTLDGDGIRFWYKTNYKVTLQFKGTSFTKTLNANPAGGWVTVYYTDLVTNGDMSKCTGIGFKGTIYVDELHTIQQKLGDIIYKVSEDGKSASVVGYSLRLENVIVENTYNDVPVTAIADNALSESKTLKSIILPDSVTTIGKNAFSNDLNLTTISLGSGITAIGENSFLNCEKLTDVKMASGITNIDLTAFNECDALILIVENNTYSKTFAIDKNIPYKCTTQDGNYTYYYNNKAIYINSYNGNEANITVVSSIDGFDVVEIGESAFKDNTTATNVTLPDSVVNVDNYAFDGCTQLVSIDFGTGVKTIGDYSCRNCTALKNITFSNVITTIGNYTFNNCSAIEKIMLPSSLTSIGLTAFASCSNDMIAIVEKESYAYNFVNEKATAIKQIPDTLSEYKYSLYRYEATVISYAGNDTVLDIPDTIDGYNVVAIGDSAFKENTNITNVYFPDYCKTIKTKAFYNCTALKDFDINDVRTIEEYAFYGCVSLGKITITNVVSYSSNAFAGCTNLQLEVTKTQFQRTALELCNSWHVGWNLGNTFDSLNSSLDYGEVSVADAERLWGAPTTTKAMIDYVASGGFDVLRLPVTWRSFIDDNNDYTIDPAYLARIKEIVDWAIADNMYVVLNMHHDSADWMDLSNYNDETCRKYQRVWQQIADYFKDYDEHLIFEAINEARTGNDWDGNSNSNLFTNFNNIQKLFYNTVRSSGGYNNVRYLMLETYGAQAKARHCGAVWYPSLEEDDHIIMSVHFYTNNTGEGNWTYNLSLAKQYFIDKGIPCVLGETGQQNYEPFFDSEHAAWVDALLNVCDSLNMKVLFWDDHGSFQMLKRTTLEWQWPSEIATIMEHAYPHDTILGDTNDDGYVNGKDVLLLKQYIAEWAVTINTTAADYNVDGYINGKDVLSLRKFIADWNVAE